MDTPIRQISWLECFPPDIWAYFAWYLPGEQLGRLLMTGATLLRQRLKSPTVVKSVILGSDLTVFQSYPTFLKELPSVQELSIYSYDRNCSRRSGITIASLPSGLRKLELVGDSSSVHSGLFGNPRRPFKLSKHLPQLARLHLGGLKPGNYSWMTHCPQSLTSLTLRLWYGDIELPTNLIHFKASRVSLSTHSFVRKLPPYLESFVVTKDLVGVELILPLLPATTSRITLWCRVNGSGGPRSAQNILEQLPRSLTWLTLLAFLEIDFKSNPELILLLPSTLTRFRIVSSIPCSAWPLLPRQLKRLSFTVPSDLRMVAKLGKVEFVSIPFDSLPRSLTGLELLPGGIYRRFLCAPPSNYNQSFFPPQLTALKIPQVQLFPATAQLLPSSLTLLEVFKLCAMVCQCLPRSLKTLRSTDAVMTSRMIQALPNSLTVLRLSPNYGLSWKEADGGKLIQGLALGDYDHVHNHCASERFNWKDSPPFPPHLTQLSLQSASTLRDTFLKYQRFPNLVEMNLNGAKNITDASIHFIPPYLTSLNLHESSRVTGKAFRFFPRCLTSLDLNSSESIFDSHIKHLPRSLKYVDFSHAVHLTESCVPDLPQKMITFKAIATVIQAVRER